jgi:hypothetical protein
MGSDVAVALHSASSSAMVVVVHLSVGSQHLKLRPLHLGLGALHLHWHLRPVHLWWLEKLVRLREARPNVASGGLSIEWYLPLAILIHLLDLVFNNNGLSTLCWKSA